jgi:hypothetical protein
VIWGTFSSSNKISLWRRKNGDQFKLYFIHIFLLHFCWSVVIPYSIIMIKILYFSVVKCSLQFAGWIQCQFN